MSRALRGPHFTFDQLIAQEELFQQAVQMMAQHRWAEAEPIFRQSIAMGDVLPQPWGNLGICLLMQRQFDAAEAALRRALEIDPELHHRAPEPGRRCRRSGRVESSRRCASTQRLKASRTTCRSHLWPRMNVI